nr:GT4 family glycosyltransferase PelF [Chromobacterium sp. ASV5]
MQPTAKSADIALLLEGTFPYVRGGVSAWVNQIIRAYPEFTFAIVFIGSQRSDYGQQHYKLPDNVVHFEEHYLYDYVQPALLHGTREEALDNAQLSKMHDAFRNNHNLAYIGKMVRQIIPMLSESGALSEQQFLRGRHSWEYISASYEKYCRDPSFTDYFWTVRIMHKPIWQLARICESLIPARMYHTVSTGYAGFLGALLHHRSHRPLLVSEHGIYTKERKIDLLQSEWIRDNRGVFEKDISQVGYFQDLWIQFFHALGRVCYDAASEITALYEGNRLRQLADGAPEYKTRNIPNGILVERFSPLRDLRPSSVPFVVALIGRVVPIKDIKTFIRAVFIASRQLPQLQGWIVGPESEDPEYAQECRDLVSSLGMEKNLEFMGFRNVDELLPKIGLVALSSISEALPLVILEAYAAGVPVISTDVGSCRQLIEGLSAEDRALGRAGRVVQIANPEQLAHAMLELLTQPQEWKSAQQAGIARTERYYTSALMEESYRQLYNRLLALPDAADESGDQAWPG